MRQPDSQHLFVYDDYKTIVTSPKLVFLRSQTLKRILKFYQVMITELEWWSGYADITCKTWARETCPTFTLSKENKAAFQKKRQQHRAQCLFKYRESPMCFLKLTHGSTHIVLLNNICPDRKTKASSGVHICSCISRSNLRLEASCGW